MENKEIKLNAVEVNDEELENVSGGTSDYEVVTVSEVRCYQCGVIINGTARYYPISGFYQCTSHAAIHVLS